VRTIASALLAVLAALTWSIPASAAEDDGPSPVAVQNRMHTMRNEYVVWVGTLPMDAFTKGLTFTGAYTIHFDDLFAWEVAQFTYSVGIDTRLKGELESLPQPVGPTPFETVEYFATSSFVFKPVYGKVALLNRALVSHEWFLVAGAGVGRLSITTRPVLDAGVGMRVYTGRRVSVRLDVRDYFFFNADDIQNELWVALGLSLGIGG
jgi:outer membrane beta-barrel protein